MSDEKKYFRDLKILELSKVQKKIINDIGPGSAWLTMKALLEVNRPGTDGYWKDFESSRKIAWKTGTSYGHRDAWAIGSNGGYTVGVWTGNADGEGRPEIIGATAAAPIMFAVFNHLDKNNWFQMPEIDLKEVKACKNDGYLPFAGCETEIQLSPLKAHFDKISPNHKTIHLDAKKHLQVNGKCESVSKMIHKTWFVLPPGQEYFYKRHYSNYKSLPFYRKDCVEDTERAKSPVQFLYPNNNSEIYIPIDLAEKKGRVVFEAAHRREKAILFWHLDDEYIGKTEFFHKQALNIASGLHRITIVDEEGNYATRRFKILSK